MLVNILKYDLLCINTIFQTLPCGTLISFKCLFFFFLTLANL